MKEYSQRTVPGLTGIGEYLTEQSKEGWEVQHIQYVRSGDPYYWLIILVRDSEQKEAEGPGV